MEKLSRAFQGIFAAIFGLCIISVAARGYVKYPGGNITAILICGIIFTAAVICFYAFFRKKVCGMTHKEIRRIFLCIAGTVLVFQVISAFTLKFEPNSDLGYVDRAARCFSQTWNKADLYGQLPEYHINYFARYTNNQALLVILSLIYSVCDHIFNCKPLIVPILINTAGLHISFLLMYLISKKIFRDKFTPLFCSIVGAGFSVFYTYTPYFYTDSMSMPFAMGSIYLFICAVEGKMSGKKALQLILSGLLLIIGFKIKGNVIILIPAYLIYLIVSGTKINRKSYIKASCILTAGIMLAFTGINAFIGSFDIADESELEEIQFPPEHWIMMGLHDRGGYYENDFWFTMNSGDYRHKKEADVREIKNRIKEYGFAGMAKHLAKKISYTWGDGTYFIGLYIKKYVKAYGKTNIFKNFIIKSPVFKFYCSIYQCMLLLMILFSFISGAVSGKKRDILLKIIICGIFFFLIVWETRSRYLVNFTPVFIITSVYSVKNIALAVER